MHTVNDTAQDGANRAVRKIIVLGGGSAGFMAAIALKAKVPGLDVLVIRSKDIGIIGVGEGSSFPLTRFLHQYINVSQKKFFDTARPTWKLGLKFLWGPRPHFFYPFGPGLENRFETLPKPLGYYGWQDDDGLTHYDVLSAMMSRDRAFPRGPDGRPVFHNYVAYHFENERYVTFLEGYATALGCRTLDDTVLEVTQDDHGVAGLVLKGGRTETADLYVDCSGFASVLLGKTLGEPFVSFKSTLFCDRAVVGGWERGADEPIKPYTTCETMHSGWAWQIEHETRVNRGYVYASSFVTDDQAEREFRDKNPKVGPTRVVKFVTGRYERSWVKNVVAIGNASGFVEPLEATALGVIALESEWLAESLIDTGGELRASQRAMYNRAAGGAWDSIRAFLGVHYRYNTRLDTPFWRECREKADLAGAGEVVDFYADNGPSGFWDKALLRPFEQFGMAGYLALLVGQKVPYRRPYVPGEPERSRWRAHVEKNKATASKAVPVKEALAFIRGAKSMARS